MEKKRIFITAHYLEIGGAETSLIGLLGAIDYSRYEVDLFLQAVRGDMLAYVPKEVRILPEIGCYSMIEEPISLCLRKGYGRVAAARLISKFKYQRYAHQFHPKDMHTYYDILDREITKVWPSLEHLGTYDLAISYIAMKTITLDKVKAKKKICWIHTDYSTVDCYKPYALPLWERFDHIVSISPAVTEAFLKYLPETATQIVEMENILPKVLILQKAACLSEGQTLFPGLKKGEVCLLSVGRICEAKNYDSIPYIAAHLQRLGIAFHWYIVGPGDHTAIDAKAQERGVEGVVTFLGASANPYPYIQQCDIYVHPSRYEGKSIVVREAQVLGKPVVITDYPTASSQVNDGKDGVIVPLNNEGCAQGIARFIRDSKLQAQIVDYLQSHDFAGESEIEKIYQLIE
mgnify:CR=1 FL=1